jgi:hypothetical protein
MELWIRSQDKLKLVNNCNLYINNRYNNEFVIKVLNEENIILGIYETKERALHVLDEIQNAIYINKLFNADINAFQKCLENEGYTEKEISNALKTISTYQMPEE